MLNCPSESTHGKKGSIVYDRPLFPITILLLVVWCWRGTVSVFKQISDIFFSPFSLSQELEAALHRDDSEFISDLIACLLQGCYQRRDIT